MTTPSDLVGRRGGEVEGPGARPCRTGSHDDAIVEAADPGPAIVTVRAESNVRTVPHGRVSLPTPHSP